LINWRALTIWLVLTSACPPPQVSNALIAGSPHLERGVAGKTVLARGRNRIGVAAPVAACRAAVRLASGGPRPGRTPDHPPRGSELAEGSRSPARSSPLPNPLPLRLRC